MTLIETLKYARLSLEVAYLGKSHVEFIELIRTIEDQIKLLESAEPIGRLVVDAYCDSGIGIEFTILNPEEKLFVGQEVFTHPAPHPKAEKHTKCACRWDENDNRVATCVRHQGWLDVVHEWAERAKEAEAKLAAAPRPKAKNITYHPIVLQTGKLGERVNLDQYTGIAYDAGKKGVAIFSAEVVKWLCENRSADYWKELAKQGGEA